MVFEMKGKMLFYSNKNTEIERFLRVFPEIVTDFEVAFASDDYQIQRGLIIKKFLVVNPSTYDSDVIVSNNSLVRGDDGLTLEDVESLANE